MEETESFKDGVLQGYHFYRECKNSGRITMMSFDRIKEYALEMLSIKFYSIVPCEWMEGFMTGWRVAKENDQKK